LSWQTQGIHIRGLDGIPEIKPGDDLGSEILTSLSRMNPSGCQESASLGAAGTIFIVAQKVVSKSEDSMIPLNSIVPSPDAIEWARRHHKDPRMIEVVFRESKRRIRMERGIVIAETQHGFICANAGVDSSNAPEGWVILLPKDPDASAECLRQQLQRALGVPVAVIIADTFGRPWRMGLTNVALGVAGLSPFLDYRGKVDSFGRPLRATVLAIADEIAAAAELVMGKTSRIPVAIIEGFKFNQTQGSARQLIRPAEEDLFR